VGTCTRTVSRRDNQRRAEQVTWCRCWRYQRLPDLPRLARTLRTRSATGYTCHPPHPAAVHRILVAPSLLHAHSRGLAGRLEVYAREPGKFAWAFALAWGALVYSYSRTGAAL
jgi:hypothetical protein